MFRASSSSPAAVLMICLLVLLVGADAAKDSNVKKIEIKDKKYSVAKLTIKAGQTVIWTNRDDNDHQVSITLDGKLVKASDDLSHDESFKFTFDKPGKYKYQCKYHPREKGEITVE
jgi:plastocyanin